MTGIWKGKAAPPPPQAMEDAARALGCDTAALRAVWEIEAAGQYYQSDGSVIRRFEPHHMPGATMDWRDSLAINRTKREAMFRAVYAEKPDAALRATSWGAPQIMGFNAQAAGHGSADRMVRDFADSAEAQIAAFVTLIQSWGIDGALRAHDWRAFARRYNGSGQVDRYARLMESAYRRHSGGARSPQVLSVGDRGEPVKRLQRALKIEADGAFGPRTRDAVEAFQKQAGLAVDGVAGQRTWAALEASHGAKPKAQDSKADHAVKLASKASAAVGSATGVAASVNRVIPPEALPTIYIVAAVVLGAGLLLYAWKEWT